MSKVKLMAFGLFSLILTSASLLKIDLQVKSLLNNKVELKIPKDFEIMDEEMLKFKYPSERRPALVYTDSSASINVAFSITKHKAKQAMIGAYKDSFVSSFKTSYPSANWRSSGVKEINGRKVGYVELVTPAIDTKVYNLLFFTDLDGQLLLCTFNCTERHLTEWEPVAKKIFNSLKIK